LNGYYYHSKADKKTKLDVIAKEVKTDTKGIKSVDYSKLTAYLIEVNKEQQRGTKTLKVQVEKIADLEERLDAMMEVKLQPQVENTNSSSVRKIAREK
jgi:hypothetical protein